MRKPSIMMHRRRKVAGRPYVPSPTSSWWLGGGNNNHHNNSKRQDRNYSAPIHVAAEYQRSRLRRVSKFPLRVSVMLFLLLLLLLLSAAFLPRRLSRRPPNATQRWFASLSLIHTLTHTFTHFETCIDATTTSCCCRSGSTSNQRFDHQHRTFLTLVDRAMSRRQRGTRDGALEMGPCPLYKEGVALPVTFFLVIKPSR
jgi:hypothetical protein